MVLDSIFAEPPLLASLNAADRPSMVSLLGIPMSLLEIAREMRSIIALILLAVAISFTVLKWKNTSRGKSIPRPSGNWLTGFRISLPPKAQDVMRRWALENGELFQIRIGWYNWVVVNSPQAMKEIFDKQVGVSNITLRVNLAHPRTSVFVDIFKGACSYWTRYRYWRDENVHNVRRTSL